MTLVARACNVFLDYVKVEASVELLFVHGVQSRTPVPPVITRSMSH